MRSSPLDLLASRTSQSPCLFLLLCLFLFHCQGFAFVFFSQGCFPSWVRHSCSDEKNVVWWVPSGYSEEQELPPLLLSVLAVVCLLYWKLLPCPSEEEMEGSTMRLFPFHLSGSSIFWFSSHTSCSLCVLSIMSDMTPPYKSAQECV